MASEPMGPGHREVPFSGRATVSPAGWLHIAVALLEVPGLASIP